MDCSRCGGKLETYSLGEKEAYVCTDCGFADTPVEHEVTPRPEPEPWTAALKRFHEKFVEGDAAIVGSGETAALVEIDREQSDGGTAVDDEDTDADVKEEDVEADADDENEEANTDDENEGADVEAEDISDVAEEREKPA